MATLDQAGLRDRHESLAWWVAIALAVAAALRYVAVFVRYDAYGIAKHFMADDSFYYFQVARHVAAGHGSTFDGVHATNGYHPLWLLITSGIFKLAGGAGDLPLMIIYGLQVIMLAGSAVLLYLALRNFDRLAAAFTAALFLASNASRNYLFNGMESSLAFLVMCALLYVATRRGKRFMVPDTTRYAWLVFGLLLVLCLTRLETALFASLWLGGALALDTRGRTGHRGRILWMALGLAIVAAAYVAVNLQIVGLPLPISGMVKAAGLGGWERLVAVFPSHRTAFAGLIGPPVRGNGLDQLSLLACVVLVVALVWFLSRPRQARLERALVFGPFIGFALGFVTAAVTVTHGSYPWYLWPALLLGTLATFALLHAVRLAPRGAPLLRAAVVAGTLFFLGAGWVSVLKTRTLMDWGPMNGYVLDNTIRYIREEIPANERVGAISSGIMTYFSGREMENLEGLINGIDFFHSRQSPAGYADYLRRNQLRWIVFRTTDPGEKERRIAEFSAIVPIDHVVDLDAFYQLDMRRRNPRVAEPGVYILRLRL